MRAGQELTRFRLQAGEEVRTPLIALEFWEGDWQEIARAIFRENAVREFKLERKLGRKI